ncbi:hypothetical protein [Herbidospora daliensis]|uniref:hypothetical protein n=1 Tax=Herbidospora daliensis TaxID=295585 RepID=UPI000785BFFD|nr:hypothetical protein [Herbidospora daliensis]
MIEGLFDRAASIFERRFLKNAFLPVLLLCPAVATPVLMQGDRFPALVTWWNGQSLTVQFVALAGCFAASWFGAAIVSSQWRNIIRLYEGYPLTRFSLLVPFARQAEERHRATRRQIIDSAENADLAVYRVYPDEEHVLPTRLGNVLRAAELYPMRRYGADLIIVWPRLYYVLPRDMIADVEDARATLEFSLVLSLWFVAFGVGGPLVAYTTGSSMSAGLLCFFGGMPLAYLLYVSAISAATEYGEHLRSAFELHRFDLLARYRLPLPNNLQEEKAQWRQLMSFIVSGAEPDWRYDPDATARLDERQS